MQFEFFGNAEISPIVQHHNHDLNPLGGPYYYITADGRVPLSAIIRRYRTETQSERNIPIDALTNNYPKGPSILDQTTSLNDVTSRLRVVVDDVVRATKRPSVRDYGTETRPQEPSGCVLLDIPIGTAAVHDQRDAVDASVDGPYSTDPADKFDLFYLTAISLADNPEPPYPSEGGTANHSSSTSALTDFWI